MNASPQRGRLFVLSGASGTGKTTLAKQLIDELGLYFSVSATTRTKRAGECEAVDYFFLGRPEFERRVAAGDFLEWAEVHGNLYGTPRQPVDCRLESGQDVLMDLDTQGALHVKQLRPQTLLIFLRPPSLEDLRARLERRGTDSPEAIQKRIERAEQEIEQSSHYDFVVLNRDLTQAKQELKDIILAVRRGRVSP